jgi:hypothetical protein
MLGELRFSYKQLEVFNDALRSSSVTHLFFECNNLGGTTDAAMNGVGWKDVLRETIRVNRSKHDLWKLREGRPEQNQIIMQSEKNWFNPTSHTCNKVWLEEHAGCVDDEQKVRRNRRRASRHAAHTIATGDRVRVRHSASLGIWDRGQVGAPSRRAGTWKVQFDSGHVEVVQLIPSEFDETWRWDQLSKGDTIRYRYEHWSDFEIGVVTRLGSAAYPLWYTVKFDNNSRHLQVSCNPEGEDLCWSLHTPCPSGAACDLLRPPAQFRMPRSGDRIEFAMPYEKPGTTAKVVASGQLKGEFVQLCEGDDIHWKLSQFSDGKNTGPQRQPAKRTAPAAAKLDDVYPPAIDTVVEHCNRLRGEESFTRRYIIGRGRDWNSALSEQIVASACERQNRSKFQPVLEVEVPRKRARAATNVFSSQSSAEYTKELKAKAQQEEIENLTWFGVSAHCEEEVFGVKLTLENMGTVWRHVGTEAQWAAQTPQVASSDVVPDLGAPKSNTVEPSRKRERRPARDATLNACDSLSSAEYTRVLRSRAQWFDVELEDAQPNSSLQCIRLTEDSFRLQRWKHLDDEPIEIDGASSQPEALGGDTDVSESRSPSVGVTEFAVETSVEAVDKAVELEEEVAQEHVASHHHP